MSAGIEQGDIFASFPVETEGTRGALAHMVIVVSPTAVANASRFVHVVPITHVPPTRAPLHRYNALLDPATMAVRLDAAGRPVPGRPFDGASYAACAYLVRTTTDKLRKCTRIGRLSATGRLTVATKLDALFAAN